MKGEREERERDMGHGEAVRGEELQGAGRGARETASPQAGPTHERSKFGLGPSRAACHFFQLPGECAWLGSPLVSAGGYPLPLQALPSGWTACPPTPQQVCLRCPETKACWQVPLARQIPPASQVGSGNWISLIGLAPSPCWEIAKLFIPLSLNPGCTAISPL